MMLTGSKRSLDKRSLLKEATHIIFSRKMALLLCKKVILTARHLFRPKNGVSKLFEIFIFFTMFMCKTQMSAGMARLSGAITFSRGLNRKIYLRGSKQDNMIRQSEKFQLFWSSRLGGDRVRKISISRYFDIKSRYFELEIENSKSGYGDLLVSP